MVRGKVASRLNFSYSLSRLRFPPPPCRFSEGAALRLLGAPWRLPRLQPCTENCCPPSEPML